MKRVLCLVTSLGLILVLTACTLNPIVGPAAATPDEEVTLTISAAANLIPAFEEVGPAFTEATGIQVVFNFGSSGNLTQQIEQGAAVDVFVAADQSFIQLLEEAGLILPDTVAIYAMGRLTLWVRSDSPLELTGVEDLTDPAVTRIAIANPELAPYGMIARQSLQNAGLWEKVESKIIQAENIGQTLQYAETGNVDVALTALSLSIAAGEDGRWVLVPDELHEPLLQALGVVSTTTQERAARRFVEFINSEAGRAILRPYGYVLPGEAAFE